MDSSEYLSKEGLEKIKSELDYLTTVKRKEIADRLEHAKSLGDLSENSEYKESKEALAFLENRILRLEDIIKRAVIIEKSAGPRIQIGSTVVARKEDPSNQEGKTCQYNVVGQEEADISAGKISNRSPLGNALIGKKKGDSIVIDTPRGKVKYKIIDLI